MNIGEPITGMDSRFLKIAGIGIVDKPLGLAAASFDRPIVPSAGMNVARTMPEPRRDAIRQTGAFSR
jgi:sialic acid synthase SpsE